MKKRSMFGSASFIAAILLATVSFAQVEFLEQNWDQETRQFYYTTSQGSRLMPYDWFLALEAADSEASFLRKRMPTFGYLANENISNNPDKLPVGFVADRDGAGKNHIGMNCAACHTNQISFQGKTYQIDGAPTLADMWTMLVEIRDSLNATLNDDQKFGRFVRALGQIHNGEDGEQPTSDEIKAELADFLVYWNQFIIDNQVDHPWGRGRLDAFGMIFNRVSSIDLELPENNRKPDAPVSYPFLWGTSWENQVQWNGSAPNTNDIERLGRNIGEVLGVFGEADLRKASVFQPYYRTSARRLNQLQLENRLKKLWSPVWPEQLGEIDAQRQLAGRVLFENHCIQCHQVIPHGQQDTPVQVSMIPITRVGTDPRMALNSATGTALTGRLQGSRILGFDPLPDQVPRGALLSNVVKGSLFSPFADIETTAIDLQRIESLKTALHSLANQSISPTEIKAFLVEIGLSEEEVIELANGYAKKLVRYKQDLNKAIDASESPAAMSATDDILKVLAYKGRPLDGIWATAPYLHNGSVPNLYELLSPVEERSLTFHVGNKEFDPIRVGFKTDQSEGTTLFDATLPGNSNAGHDSYGTFSEAERWQLVEYMKTL